MTEKRVLGVVLAGGPGKRLAPLTAHRPQSAVPFGGIYRLVDFALSLNLIDHDRPDLVVVVGADHVYRMDPAQMISQHAAWGAGARSRSSR